MTPIVKIVKELPAVNVSGAMHSRRRIVVLERDEGLFTFAEEYYYVSQYEGEIVAEGWARLPPNGIYATADAAESDGRAVFAHWYWLADVIVVNENDDSRSPGDVQVYRSEGELSRELESWYVSEVRHLALTGTGEIAILGLRGDLVIVEQRQPSAAGLLILQQWLTAKSQAILSARKKRENRGQIKLGTLEAKGILPDSIEGLIAYVGFDR